MLPPYCYSAKTRSRHSGGNPPCTKNAPFQSLTQTKAVDGRPTRSKPGSRQSLFRRSPHPARMVAKHARPLTRTGCVPSRHCWLSRQSEVIQSSHGRANKRLRSWGRDVNQPQMTLCWPEAPAARIALKFDARLGVAHDRGPFTFPALSLQGFEITHLLRAAPGHHSPKKVRLREPLCPWTIEAPAARDFAGSVSCG
jgi:hypothetical protein